jgi:hypothetical protein
MAKVKLLSTEGYGGLEAAVGKTFEATQYLGHWNVSGADLEEAGCTVRMAEYVFLRSEVEVLPCLTRGL